MMEDQQNMDIKLKQVWAWPEEGRRLMYVWYKTSGSEDHLQKYKIIREIVNNK